MLECIQNNTVVTAHTGLVPYDGYNCPSCHKELILKSGGCNKPHFSHLINEGCKHRDPSLKRASPKLVDEPKKLIMKGIELLVEGVLLAVENQRGSKS